ncbi:protein FAM32A-like [Phoenix dactylifera]|uniref:Protein FAM32A-like n=1 Tax=Phoenix dactylifera TaxID=42345 RepID=A0A8B7CWJ2_PHODC|nr:protein FAM32A-like [Phoenix dactylifera]XP_008807666.1 protein FAM32A-like [Phoenix dactylifera]
MSAYENVVGGKLKLKGKALDVKTGGVKKKTKQKHHYNRESQIETHEPPAGESAGVSTDPTEESTEADKLGDGHTPACDDHLTPAERRYVEQREKINRHRLAKTANKSHRDRIQDFNQYLANLSEHYDIPKVGPG